MSCDADYTDLAGAASRGTLKTGADLGFSQLGTGRGGCTEWDQGGTLWDEYIEGGLLRFTTWDCRYTPGAVYEEKTCQAQ